MTDRLLPTFIEAWNCTWEIAFAIAGVALPMLIIATIITVIFRFTERVS